MLVSSRSSIAIANVSTDAMPALRVRGVIGVRERKSFGRAEMRLDEIQP